MASDPIAPVEFTEKPRGRAWLLIADALLLEICKTGTRRARVIENALPADAQMVGVEYDGRNVRLLVESGEFTPIQPGDVFPVLPCPLFQALD